MPIGPLTSSAHRISDPDGERMPPEDDEVVCEMYDNRRDKTVLEHEPEEVQPNEPAVHVPDGSEIFMAIAEFRVREDHGRADGPAARMEQVRPQVTEARPICEGTKEVGVKELGNSEPQEAEH